MVPWLRNLLLLIAGLLLASFLITAVQLLGHRFLGLPVRPPYPAVAFVLPLLSYLLGMAAAAWLVARFAVGRARLLAGVLAIILFLLALFNTTQFPHPWWFLPAAALALAAGWAAGVRRRASAA